MPPQTSPSSAALPTFHAGHGVAVTIILGLAMIYGLHFLGFRFVVAAGVGR